MSNKGRTIAKLRDEFFKSDEGRRCANVHTLSTGDSQKYLRNRLERAFLAGVEAGESFAKQHQEGGV